MEDRIRHLEERVEALSRTVEQLQLQVSGLAPLPFPPPPPLAEVELTGAGAGAVVTLIGRSLLIIAGAFVFRALTDRGVVRGGIGVSLGLLFAVVWIALAWREAGRARRLSAGFYAGAAAVIAFPLVVETASRLGVLDAAAAALALTGFCGALLVLAARHRLQEVAWVGVLGTVVAAPVLISSSGTPTPFVATLFALATASLALARWKEWPLVRWLPALALDLVVVRGVFTHGAEAAPRAAVIAVYALVVLYVGALLVRTWRWRLPLGPFEITQTVLVMAVALTTLGRAHAGAGAVGAIVAALVLGTAVFLAKDAARDAWFYTGGGVLLALVAGPLLLPAPAIGLAFGALALALSALGRWRLPVMFWTGAALLSWATALGSGALGLIWAGLARQAAPGVAAEPAALAAIAIALLVWLTTAWRAAGRDEPGQRAPALAMLVLVAIGAVAAVATSLPALRLPTVLASATGVALALGRRIGGPIELGWGSGALVGLGALELLVSELPHADAARLVLGFLGLGLAIVLVPWLLKGRARPSPPAAPLPSR